MDLRRLEVFCKVVEFRSFSKAAKALLLSQPTVSEHIRTLEIAVGETLLDRLGREVLPTQAGQILYRYAYRILRLREEALQAMARYSGDLSGRLILGASTIPGTYVLPRIIGSFKDLHSSIQLTLKILSTGEIVEAVLKGDLEVGLVGSQWKDRRLRSEEIFSDELVLTVYRQILEAHGFDFSRLFVVAEMATTQAIRQSIKARIGISILSRQAVEEDLQRSSLVAVPIRDIQFHRPFFLIQREGRQQSPLCEAFIEHVRLRGRGEPTD